MSVATASQGGNSSERSFWQELFHTGFYKRNQGRMTRRLTLAALIVASFLFALRFYGFWASFPEFWHRTFEADAFRYLWPAAVLVLGSWIGFRLVNFPKFADFLISVEAEMNKVSWPSRAELVRSSLVVMVVIGLLVGILFSFDLLVRFVLGDVLGVLRMGK